MTKFKKMMQTSVWLLASLLMSAAFAQPEGWSPLMEPADLASVLDSHADVRVIHVTGDFDEGHIPGAISAPYAQFRGPQNSPGTLPPMAELTSLVQGLGINADTPVVIVHQGNNTPDMGTATRVYWTLKSLGVHHLAVLNGGFSGWLEQQLPVSTHATDIARSDFQPVWRSEWQIDADQIEQLIETGNAQLIDARPAAFFEGEQTVAVRAGTIPGASNFSFQTLFDGNRMKASSELDAMLSSSAINNSPGAVSFCNSGQLGSITWFVMSELAGMESVRLYAESMMEWAASDRPMMNEP